MNVVLTHGGCLNDLGPFEPGSVVTIPDADALYLIEVGAATAVVPRSARPITISISLPAPEEKGVSNV